jgi:alkyl sulfatase BDS1-like metallo-beta-lactamase superfamily hydrolase
MSTELWLNSLGISLDSRKVAGQNFTIILITPDNNEKFVIELSNSVLTNIKGQLAKKPDLTITVNRSELERVMAARPRSMTCLRKARQNSKATQAIRGSAQRPGTLTPDFEMMPGTAPKGPKTPSTQKPFEAHEPADTSGG